VEQQAETELPRGDSSEAARRAAVHASSVAMSWSARPVLPGPALSCTDAFARARLKVKISFERATGSVSVVEILAVSPPEPRSGRSPKRAAQW